MHLSARMTTIAEGIGIAIDALRANKSRAALTILGVAIGVFVVVAMSSVVRGVNESFARDLEAAGVVPRPVGPARLVQGEHAALTLRLASAEPGLGVAHRLLVECVEDVVNRKGKRLNAAPVRCRFRLQPPPGRQSPARKQKRGAHRRCLPSF